MKAFQGVKMSFELQTVIQKNEDGYFMGYRESDNKIASLNHVYGMIARHKQYRRPYVLSVIKQFDDKKSSPGFLYFLTENLAYTTYSTQEEPLFLIHHIDTLASVSGANILQAFKELLVKSQPSGKTSQSDEDDDDMNDQKLSQDETLDTNKLLEIVEQSFGCCLLLELKYYLKTLYGFTDAKCQKYSPSEPSKLYDKAITRKTNQDFNSDFKETMFFKEELSKDQMLDYYFQFKQMMMSLDTEDDSDTEDIKRQDQSGYSPNDDNDEEGDSPTNEQSEPQKQTEIQSVKSEQAIDERDVKNVEQLQTSTEILDEKPRNSGVVPQSKESSSLPGLNIDIPIIPMKILESNAQNNCSSSKPKKQRAPSRRSSRSSRCSAYTDD